MKKALIKTPTDNGEKVAASTYSIHVHHKGGRVTDLSHVNYTYEDVFEYIKEKYHYDQDSIQKIIIEVEN